MSATDCDANAVRTRPVFVVDVLEALHRLRRTPGRDGRLPDLRRLAMAVDLPQRQTNLALDALIGRTPRQAAIDLYDRGLAEEFLPDAPEPLA